MKGKLIWSIFWAIVAVLIITICIMFVFAFADLEFNAFAILPVFFVLGIALLVVTVKKKITGLLLKFLLLTGSSAAGILVFAILHNLITALFINFFDFNSDFDEPVFFTLATIVCPLGLLVGVVGTIVISLKNKANIKAITP